ncbi:ribosomal protein S5 domain 2-type protein [Umbelopsis sp. PMI_123]|nr:ribosomal protein S5 domain 2-type protein [Umbelopsis sp. PMI_123]
MPYLSQAERHYITEGVHSDLRADGRGRLDCRALVLETGIISQASGSARVRLGDGTDILVGVKVEIDQVEPDANNVGKIVCNVECSPSASQQFEGHGADDLNNELTQALQRILGGPQCGINFEKLCIIKGQQCWVVYIDAMILDYSGNVFDAIFMATKAALYNTRIPKTQIQDLGDGEFEFEVLDDVEDAERLDGIENIPIGVTLNKIGTGHIIDATPLEELCTEAKLTIAVNKDGQICGIQKGAEGGIEPGLMSEMIQTAKRIGQSLILQLDQKLQDEERQVDEKRLNGENIEKLGFFAMV